MKTPQEQLSADKISRKDALKKAGMYAAFTAAASVMLLTPKTAQAQPSVGWGTGGYHPTPPGGDGGGSQNSPFTKPEPTPPPSGMKDSPWK